MFFKATNAGHIRKLADAFLACRVGQQVTYATLSHAMGADAQEKSYMVQSALRLANKDSGALFRNVKTIGYERMPAGSAHTVGKTARQKIRSTARRAVDMIGNAVIKANDLSDGDRLKAYSEQAGLGIIQHMSYDRNMPVVREGSAPPPTADTVRDTMNALREHSRGAGG